MAIVVEVEGVDGSAPELAFGSRHSQAEQYCVLTLSPQQSPPSHSHPQLLFPSSQT